MSDTPVYLDYQATTPTDPRVVDVMLPLFTEEFGNAHSVDHSYGQKAAELVEKARKQVADLIAADPREIIFTSGATEANNLALKGVMAFLAEHPVRGQEKRRVLVSAVEHKCVLEAARTLARQGWDMEILPVDGDGLLDMERLRSALAGGDVALVSVMAVNNETAVVQDLAAIGRLCRDAGAYFHTDAAQAAGKIELDVEAMQIDLMSLSGHKAYGPKGVGALYVRRRPRVRLLPLLDGGGQERGLRSGTLPVPLVAGFGVAAALALVEQEQEQDMFREFKQLLLSRLQDAVPGVLVNGSRKQAVENGVNLRISGVSAPELLRAMPELALSMGSACSSAELEPSYVLRAMGLDEEAALESFRLGMGRFTTREEVERTADVMIAAIRSLRAKAA
ncbi:cysteine desulfurase family protein [Kiloniella sp. b19]|uniref:cysteine desulfurase family protein n=1 Tax=Kiloniella sp. GXU_MW_B19 TaxID=3141326 RepID=UPI0031D4E4D6